MLRRGKSVKTSPTLPRVVPYREVRAGNYLSPITTLSSCRALKGAIEVSGEARCAGVAHDVETLDLCASSLRQLSADEVAGEVSVGGVGAGGRSAQRLSSFSRRGDPAACRRAGFDDEGCQVPWRIQLRRLAELPGGMPAFFA